MKREATAQWVTGDQVSKEFRGVIYTGRVKRTHPRMSDGKTFIRIKLTSGPNEGHEDWLTPGWLIGVGPLERVCVDCGVLFRTAGSQDMCPCCVRDHAPQEGAAAISQAHFRNRLYGPRTKSRS